MGAGVDHTVLDMVVGQVLVIPAAEGKLQHFHAGKGAVSQQLPHAGEQLAQVLGDDGQLAQRSLQGLKEVHAGAVFPLAGLGGGTVGRDGPVGIEAPEVVDAQQVVDAQGMAHPLDPPCISSLFMIRPVIQRVAPQLTVGGEIIRRAACHTGKTALGIQLEQLAAHPGIHRVGRDIDGDIAQDLHTLVVGILLHSLPLGAELVLYKLPEADLFLVFGSKGGQRSLVPQAVGALPLHPVLHAVGHFQSHVQGIILQPCLVAQGEGIVVIREVIAAAVQALAGLSPGRIGGAQHLVAAGVQGAVVHLLRVIAPGLCLELGCREQAFFLQGIKVDEVGVARKGGAALIGAVAVAGGAQGQQLPDLLPGIGQKIHKFECFLAKAANSIRAGQAGHRHQDSTFTHGFTFLTFHILTGNLLILIIT